MRIRSNRVRLIPVITTAVCLASSPTRADGHNVTRAEHDEIAQLLETFFDAARDSDTHALGTVIPDDAQFARIFEPGTEPLVERHRRAIARALEDLHTRFAGGRFTRIRGFDVGSEIRTDRCAPFASPRSECTVGPVIEWTVGTATRTMQINRLVRVDGHWRIFSPRL